MVREVAGKRAWLIVAVAMAAFLPAQSATRSLEVFIEAVIRNGLEGKLPAHLSVVLGVSQIERQTAVKQAVIRNASMVRTFNVCTGKHDDVVILTYDELSHATKAYLTSATGKLRKAVDYQPGAAANERSLADASSDFTNEITFWTNFAQKPAQLK
jgi:voltage-gated potassium channel Kch